MNYDPNRQYGLSDGIAASRAASRVRGPFFVLCPSCGKYVRELRKTSHIERCREHQEKCAKILPLARPAPPPPVLVAFESLPENVRHLTEPALEKLQEDVRTTVLTGQRICHAAANIAAIIEATERAENDPNRCPVVATLVAEAELAKIPDLIRPAVRYELERKGWHPTALAEEVPDLKTVLGATSEQCIEVEVLRIAQAAWAATPSTGPFYARLNRAKEEALRLIKMSPPKVRGQVEHHFTSQKWGPLIARAPKL